MHIHIYTYIYMHIYTYLSTAGLSPREPHLIRRIAWRVRPPPPPPPRGGHVKASHFKRSWSKNFECGDERWSLSETRIG